MRQCAAILLVLGGCSSREPTSEAEMPDAEVALEYCDRKPLLDPSIVTATGYDDLFAFPTADIAAANSKCATPPWMTGLDQCPTGYTDWDWDEAATPEEARLLLLWRAWCWHGANLDRNGTVTCGEDTNVRGSGDQRLGEFTCTVEYNGIKATRLVQLRI